MAGFGWALERGYNVIVEMDADGSHQPEHLPSLAGALANPPAPSCSSKTPYGRRTQRTICMRRPAWRHWRGSRAKGTIIGTPSR